MKQIELSIIIPCYNCSKTIERALLSIATESLNKVEIICVDDCSKDETIEIIQSFANQNKNYNIRLIESNKNSGAGKTRSTGISHAVGKYIVFLDSDDYFSNNAIETLLSYTNGEYDLVTFDAIDLNNNKLGMFFANKFQQGEVSTRDCLAYVRGCTCGKMYKKSVIDSNRIEFGKTKVDEDLVFTKKAVSCCNKNYYLQEPLYVYDMGNGSSLMHNVSIEELSFEDVAYNDICEFVDLKKYQEEMNVIYFLEVLISKTKRHFFARCNYKKTRTIFKNDLSRYQKKDKYRHSLLLKYRVFYLFLRLFYFAW